MMVEDAVGDQSIRTVTYRSDGDELTLCYDLWNTVPGARALNGAPYQPPNLASPLAVQGESGELAVGSASAPRTLLRGKGWSVCDPREPTRDPWTYRSYIEASKAEFSVAKHGYVVTRSGWFSDRSAAYLATGRPVLLQETGFSDWLKTGSGIIPFNTPEEAFAGIEEINNRFDFHCRAARDIAEEYFDMRKVLPALIECAMNSA